MLMLPVIRYTKYMKEAVRIVGKPFVFVYNKTHWFSDQEAWVVYRFFAIAEAIGWTLLIGAIVYRAFDLPAYEAVVSIAGRMHGIIFALYFLFVLITARSMGWGLWRIGGALAAGIPPYTGLVFEQVMAWHRKKYPQYIEPPEEPTN